MDVVWTLLVLAAVAVPVALLLLFLRRPYDRDSVPRDAMAVRAKANLRRPGVILPGDAFDDVRDDAADQSDESAKTAGD